MMQTERGQRRERGFEIGREDGPGWELVEWVGWRTMLVEEEDLGQGSLGMVWELEWLLVRVLLP
jgi:hypothetical protein